MYQRKKMYNVGKKTKVVDYAPCCLRTIASSFKCMIPYHRHLDCWNLVNSGLSVNIYTYRWGVGNACCELVNKAQKKKLLLTLNETEIQRIIKPQLIKIIIIISSIWPHYWYKKYWFNGLCKWYMYLYKNYKNITIHPFWCH